jgi:protein-arginine kinase
MLDTDFFPIDYKAGGTLFDLNQALRYAFSSEAGLLLIFPCKIVGKPKASSMWHNVAIHMPEWWIEYHLCGD